MANSTIGGRRTRTVIGGAIAATALLPASAAWAGGHPQPPPTTEVIATGLLNPRGVEVGLDGSVYVAESGAGGTTLAQALVEGEPAPVCLGNTGAVEKFRHGRRALVGNFASMTAAFVAEDGTASCDPASIGAESVGPSDVAVHLDGSIAVSMGLGGNVDTRVGLPAPFDDAFGKLLSVSRRGHVSEIADITAYEHTANPDGGEDDSNPYGVASFFGTHFVADAGGNDVVAVDRRGNVSTLAVIPGPDAAQQVPSCGPAGLPAAQAVPTSVAIGPDGAVYVGQLTGFPFTKGVAKVFRIDRRTGAVTTFAEGFTNIVGIAWGPDRSLYVLEIARDGLLCGPQGRLVKIKRGVQSEVVVPDGLTAPGGVAVGLDNTIYVTNHSTEPGGAGELLAIHQH